MIEKNQNHHLRKAAGHNSVSPYYCGTGCNFLWKDIGKFQWWEVKSKRKSFKQLDTRHNSVPQTQDQDTIVYPDTINIMFKIVKLKIEYTFFLKEMFKFVKLKIEYIKIFF